MTRPWAVVDGGRPSGPPPAAGAAGCSTNSPRRRSSPQDRACRARRLPRTVAAAWCYEAKHFRRGRVLLRPERCRGNAPLRSIHEEPGVDSCLPSEGDARPRTRGRVESPSAARRSAPGRGGRNHHDIPRPCPSRRGSTASRPSGQGRPRPAARSKGRRAAAPPPVSIWRGHCASCVLTAACVAKVKSSRSVTPHVQARGARSVLSLMMKLPAARGAGLDAHVPGSCRAVTTGKSHVPAVMPVVGRTA